MSPQSCQIMKVVLGGMEKSIYETAKTSYNRRDANGKEICFE